LKLIETLMLATEHFPIFLILLFRPDLDKPVWQLKLTADMYFAHRYLELKLSPLDTKASRQMINNLLEVANFPDDLREMVGEKAQGNPLYVEELIRSLIESEFLVRNGKSWQLQAGRQSWKCRKPLRK
jgi:predicted ATPase